MSCGNGTYTPFLTPEYLQDMHSISLIEAELLCEFAKSHTIRYKECYGDGSIIFPMWMEELKEAKRVIGDLIKKVP